MDLLYTGRYAVWVEARRAAKIFNVSDHSWAVSSASTVHKEAWLFERRFAMWLLVRLIKSLIGKPTG